MASSGRVGWTWVILTTAWIVLSYLTPLVVPQCPTGYFGVNCSLPCRCQFPEKCRDDGCSLDFKCERGYGDPPTCQTPCSPVTFGVNCGSECHCPPMDRCDPVSGVCASGQCASEYYGSSCQTKLPRLVTPPLLSNVICNNVTLVWDKWDPDVDWGDPPVGSYTVQYQFNGTATWDEFQLVSNVVDVNVTSFTVTVTDLQVEVAYRFRIISNRIDNGKKVDGLASPSTSYVTPCSVDSENQTKISTTDSATAMETTTVIGFLDTSTQSSSTSPILPTSTKTTEVLADVTTTTTTTTMTATSTSLRDKTTMFETTTNLKTVATTVGDLSTIGRLTTATTTNDATTLSRGASHAYTKTTGPGKLPLLSTSTSNDYMTTASRETLSDVSIPDKLPSTTETMTVEPTSIITTDESSTFTTAKEVTTIKAVEPTTITTTVTLADTTAHSPTTTLSDLTTTRGPSTFTKYHITERWTDTSTATATTTAPTTTTTTPTTTTEMTTSEATTTTEATTTMQATTTERETTTTEVPTTSTEPLTTTTTTEQTTTTQMPVPQPVTSLQATAVSSDSVLVNWSAPSSAFLVESYRISYQISGYGNCTESPTTSTPLETVSVPASTTSYRIQGLATWTAYRIVVTSANRIGTSVDRIVSVVTSADVPVTKVQGLTSSDTHPTSVTIQWASPACRHFLGYVQQYQLFLYRQMNLIRSVNVTLTSFTVEGLEPYTTYAARVALMNEVGVGPLNEQYNFSTSEDVPSAPQNLALQAAGNTSLLIGWQAPQSPNGILLQYRVTYRATSDRSGALITRLLAPQGQINQAELLNLSPYTVYNISVAARTSVGWGPESAHLSARTDESVPSAPTSLVLITRNESCLAVNWRAPAVPNGMILTYRIHYQQGLSYSTGQDQIPETGTLEVPANRSSHTLCLLRLSTQYEITVSAATSKGFGQGLIKTFMTIIGDPTAPTIPTVQSYTTSTITVLLQPVILTTGPLSYYLVSVLRLQGNVGRRRRRRALGLNDLPGNIVARFEPNNLETTFTVGDNATNGGYANPSLKASTIYNVYFAVVSSLDGVTKIAYSDLDAPVLTLSDTPTTTLAATTTPTTTTTATTVTTTPVTTTTTTITTPMTTTANVVTTEGVATAPTGLAAPTVTANDIRLTWNAVPGATEYELWYNSTAEPGVVYNTSVPVGGSFLLTNLLPYTSYTLMLRARTSAGWGPFSTLTKLTDEDVPSKPGALSRQNRNETCLWLKWQPPSSPNGIITFYKLTYKATRFFSNVGSVQEESVEVPGALTTRVICNLAMAAAYEITLEARTSKGYGARSGETFYTLIGEPEAPSPPEVVSTEETSMIVTLKPVLITTGPLSYYLVKVEKLSSRRKKRATVEDIPGNSVVKIETLDFAGKSEINFKIGSGTVRNGYNNSVLEPGTLYNVRFVVVSSLDGATKASFAALSEPVRTKGSISTGQSGSDGDGGVVVYVVVAILAVLVLIAAMIIALWWFRKQRNAKKSYEPEWVGYYKNNFMGEEKGDVYGVWNETFDLEESRYVLMTKESPSDISIGRLRDRPPISIEQEYYKLPQGQQFPCHTAERPENINKNHCSKILAYEHSRVVLRDVENGITDYINANFIDGYKKRKAFIAAQSPFTDETVVDFWRMILQENVSQIVMVTRPIEDGVPKCEQYWPNEGNLKYGKIHVRIVESTDFAHFTVRKFQLFVQEKEIKHVSQYHFTSWPDHGCPEDPIPFLEFHHRVKADTHAQDGPILVHCGTGVSRTATFIAIDALTKQAEMEKKVNVWKFANEMRKNRVHMIRTLKQYMYIYDALMEKLIVEEPYVSFNLRKKYKALSQINPSTTKSYFDEQFQTLQRFTPDSKTDDCSGLSVENRGKNRYISIMPVDKFRPRILTHGGSNTSDYINAIFIDSYTRHNQFILTQSPMVNTVTDFWKLVYDYQVSLILMLDDRALQDDSCGEYLPPHTSEPAKFDIFQVQLTNIDESPQHVTVRDLKFHNVSRAHEKSRVIRHIQIDEWPMKQHVPTNTDSFMSLLDMAEEWLKEADDPKRVLIHCIDGASHSGLFVSVMCLCEKMRIDGEVDVFHTVKHIKRRRSQVIGNLTQYKFCHKVLWDYMNTRINHKVKGLTSTLANGHASHDRDDISRLSYDDDEADDRMGTYRLNGNISPIPNGTPHSTMYDTVKDSYDSFTESESAVD